MFCTKCGKEITNAALGVCTHCGNTIKVEQQPNQSYGGYGYQTVNPVENFNIITAYISWFKKYACFKGRSRRSEYWYGFLANTIVGWILQIIVFATYKGTISGLQEYNALLLSHPLLIIFNLVTFLPVLAAAVRRLHDTGRSGWYYFMMFVPLAGPIIFLVFLATDSQPGVNKYGTCPKGYNF